jgi:hypothetical protein
MGARRWIGLGLAVVVVAVAAFVIAQSGGGGGGGPLDAIAKAAEVTQREPGGRAVINATVKSLTTPEGIAESGSMTFESGGRTRGELTAKGLTNGKEVHLVAIADGSKSYVSSDALDSLPEGKKWQEIDYGSAVKGGPASDPAGNGPEEGLKTLEGVEDSEKVGTLSIDGVPTTHYRGTLPTSDEVFGVKVNVEPPQIDVWIDAQDRVRRMKLIIIGSVGKVATQTKMTTDFVEFGRVPKIELPPADEVFNATSEVESQIQETAEGG